MDVSSLKRKSLNALRYNLFSICRSRYLIHLPLDSFDFFRFGIDVVPFN